MNRGLIATLTLAALSASAVAAPRLTAEEVVLLDRTLTLSAQSGRYRLLDYRNAEWYGSTFFTGPDWTRVGKDWHHPGQETPSVRRFQVPQSGRVTITGSVLKRHLAGDGIRAVVRHNDRDVWQAEIDGTDDQGVDPNLTLDVQKGDTIRFVVHKRGAISCDTTGWDPVITYDGGRRHQASDGFAKHQQGHGGWSYEMQIDPASDPRAPLLCALAPDLAVLEQPIVPGRPVELTHRDALPILVVSGGGGRREPEAGLAVAMAPAAAWTFRAARDEVGRVRVTFSVPGGSEPLPAVWSEAFEGPWTKGLLAVDEQLESPGPLAPLRPLLQGRFEDGPRSLAFWAMIQDDWQRQDGIDGSTQGYAAAVHDQLDRAGALVAHLRARSRRGEDFLAAEGRQLEELSAEASQLEPGSPRARALWLAVHRLKRRIALANPWMQFGPMLFTKRVPPSYGHLVAQYYGWRQRPGGGLFVLDKPGRSLEVSDVLAGQLPEGNVLEPRLSYDARRIVFSFVACSGAAPDPKELRVNEEGDRQRYFHVYEINVDGSGLRQLTDGPYDDMMPTYLPDGDIVFCSTRRRAYARCFGPTFSKRWDSYTLHRMGPDGSDLRILSLNDVSEWFPAVSHSGHLLFARWDYIDRDAVTHQNLWAMRPDGTNPVAVWGNAAPKPHCSFQAKPIPGSGKIVFIASAHHAITAGPVCVVDPTVDANSLEAVERITPLAFPEAEGPLDEWYASPWPLSENYFLAAYSPERLRFESEHMHDPNPDNALGIVMIDRTGNRELIYRDPEIGSTNPTPLVPRAVPPVLPSTVRPEAAPTGEMVVADVYEGLDAAARGKIKSLRIVQLFPKTTPLANSPRIGLAGEENGRAILGTVPVEPDGSARFLVPARTPILLQVLDEDGFAYQTMRSSTYVQPGERVSCVGCHEHRMSAPPATARVPSALSRPASRIDPGELGGRPFSFVEIVQPVLDRHCVRCHGPERTDGGIDLTTAPHQGFTRSYWALCASDSGDWRLRREHPELSREDLVPRFWQRNQIQVTPPGGEHGALGSRLMKLLRAGHEDVALSPAELGRLAAWIDMNAIFYGVYDLEEQSRQLRGERVAMPEIR